ncbi:hypothetical protein ACFWBC_38490 [Streptomyces sp. NPDC059985]|uniref:hypothetical protein n=1 Tax=Streptomyces sp. NPDC059985 TaxID=3347025 RepID=UPI0036848C23
MATSGWDFGSVPRKTVLTVLNRSADGERIVLGTGSGTGPVKWKHGESAPGTLSLVGVGKNDRVYIKAEVSAHKRPVTAEITSVDDNVRAGQTCDATGDSDTWCMASLQLGRMNGTKATIKNTGKTAADIAEKYAGTEKTVRLAVGANAELPTTLRDLVISSRSQISVTDTVPG